MQIEIYGREALQFESTHRRLTIRRRIVQTSDAQCDFPGLKSRENAALFVLTRSWLIWTDPFLWPPVASHGGHCVLLLNVFFSLFLHTDDVRKLPVSPAAKRGIPHTCKFRGRTTCMISTPYYTFVDCGQGVPQLCPNFPPKLWRGSSATARVAQTRQFAERTMRNKLIADDFLEIFCEWVLGIWSKCPQSAPKSPRPLLFQVKYL